MKILYISGNQRSEQFPWLTDYQDDCLLLGLKELFGDEVVDCNKRFHLYSDYSDDQLATEYGRGFTICRNITSDNADREDITKKIRNKYFDYVIYGSIWRCQDHLQLVLENYDKKKIVFVDGEDTNMFVEDRVKDGVVYFKRELYPDQKQIHLQEYMQHVLPISFAFPTAKVNKGQKKERRVAHSDPRDKKTYVFNSEKEYYQDYMFSKYAFSMPKAGWDCLRHYEIMGNGCMPLFENIHECPRHIMMHVPKALLTKIMFWHVNDQKWLMREYNYYLEELQKYVVKFCTTEAVAKRFVSKLELYK